MDFPDITKKLFFEKSEYQGRLARIRAEMSARGLDVLILNSPENLLYVSGYQTIGFANYQHLIIPAEGPPFFILRFMETMLVSKYSWIEDVVAWDETDDPVAVTVDALNASGLNKGRIGIEERSFFFNVANWKKMKAALPDLTDGSGVVDKVRAIKSPQEIAYMREAAALTDIGMAAGLAEIRPGAKDNDIAAAASEAMMRAGSEWLCRDPIISVGQRAGVPHTTFMRTELEQGDTVMLEFSGVYLRHNGPLMRGAVVGPASDELKRMEAVCLEGLEAVMSVIKPGCTSGEVDEAAKRIIVREGLWDNYRKRAGYSIGLGMASWIEGSVGVLKEGDTTELQPGMCFHVPIALRLYGRAGFGFSESIVVTETGCEPLGKTARNLVEC